MFPGGEKTACNANAFNFRGMSESGYPSNLFMLLQITVSNKDSTLREDYLSSILILVNDLLGVLLQNNITDAAMTNPAHYIIIVMVQYIDE